VRDWLRRGLPTISDQQRPLLILGRDLAAFLSERRVAAKRPCQPAEIYCVRCRLPRTPAGSMADYVPVTPTSGNLVGICPVCEALMYRRINVARLPEIHGQLDVALPQARQHIDETNQSSVDCYFGQECSP
jgi:hypothetical protein